MELAKAGQKGVYHGGLRDATQQGPIAIRLTGEPTACKYPKPGNSGFFINFQYEGRDYNYTIENAEIVEALKGFKGHMVEITARGAREDATLEVVSVAGPGTNTPPPNRAAAPHRPAPPQTERQEPPPRRENPPTDTRPMSAEERRAAKEQAEASCLQRARAATMKISNGMLMALRGAHHSRQTFEQESGVKMTNEHFQAMTASIFIALDRTGVMNDMPTHPLPPKNAPAAHAKPAATPARQPDPEPEAPEEPELDDIPF